MYLFVKCKDYDDLEFSIVSLDGRQWLFEAAALEVSCLRFRWALMFYNNLTYAPESCTRNVHK